MTRNLRKMTLTLVAALSIFSALLSTTGSAQAQQLQPAVIAFIDYQKVLRDAVAAKNVHDQIQVFRNEFQQELAQSEQALRGEEQELKRQRPILSAEAFAARRRAFEDNVARAQRTVQDRNRMLDRSYSKAMNQISVTVRKIVAGMSDQMGFNYVVERTQIMFAKRDFNITKQVLEQLNIKLPAIKVPRQTAKAE